MKKVVIAFDIDGTLRDNRKAYNHADATGNIKINERIRSLLTTLASFKNTTIVLWSGGGELYARQVAREIGIAGYIDIYAGKDQADTINADIAIDDIQACELGILNLIVREK
jgi:hydroxymethylpyrimidine pyrophosphatase-like HAD family hydrolase